MTPSIDLARLTVRDPAAALRTLRQQWRGHAQWWIFGYASLIWRPEFDAAEHRPALVHGWHRALRMRSRVNRGTPQQPGLVFALLPGGACRGVVYRMRPEQAEAELDRLWEREMPTGVYDPRLLPCRPAPLDEPRELSPAMAYQGPPLPAPSAEPGRHWCNASLLAASPRDAALAAMQKTPAVSADPPGR